jgi:hypothetical protein
VNAESPPTPRTFYPQRIRWEFIFYSVMAAGFSFGLVSAILISPPLVVWLVLVAVVVVPMLLLWRTVYRRVRQIRRRLPVLRLDPTGLECFWGRVRWRDVQSLAAVYPVGDGVADCRIQLLPGTHWQPIDTNYTDTHIWRDKDGCLIVVEWNEPQQLIDAAHAFGYRPLTAA